MPQAATVCVVLSDHAMHRNDNPVHKPNGYLRSMLLKVERGELHLHKSVSASSSGVGAA